MCSSDLAGAPAPAPRTAHAAVAAATSALAAPAPPRPHGHRLLAGAPVAAAEGAAARPSSFSSVLHTAHGSTRHLRAVWRSTAQPSGWQSSSRAGPQGGAGPAPLAAGAAGARDDAALGVDLGGLCLEVFTLQG